MELKEMIEVLKQELELSQANPTDKRNETFSFAISHLEILQEVKEAGGVKRKEIPEREEYTGNYDDAYGNGMAGGRADGFNACLDAVHAELARKLEGLEGQIKHWGNDSIIFTGIKDDLIQVIRSHILGTGKKEE